MKSSWQERGRKLFGTVAGHPEGITASGRRALSRLKDKLITTLPKRIVEIIADNRWHVSADIGRQIEAYRKSSNEIQRKIVVYTALLNDYNTLLLPDHIHPDVDYVCFTDRPRNDYGVWQVRSLPFADPDPTRMARYVKMHAHELFPAHEVAVWIDANILLKGDVHRYVDKVRSERGDLGLVRHPERDCFYEEAEACKRFGKDDAGIIGRQVEQYRREGLPLRQPLFETGFMVIPLRNERTAAAFRLWWQHIERFSRRDQLSFAWVSHAMPDLRLVSLLDPGQSVRNHKDFRYFRHSYARALVVPAVLSRYGVVSNPEDVGRP